jgi:peptidoglycan/LPS O-acetylase OafA/YrhL
MSTMQEAGPPGSASDRPSDAGGSRLVVVGLIAFGVYHVALALFMAVAPGTFFGEVGPFGVQNDHYIRDTATFNLAFGAALLAAVRYRSWRVPVLALVLVQFALHAINHLVDIGEADPEWVGVADFISLTVATALLAGLLRDAWRDARRLRTN